MNWKALIGYVTTSILAPLAGYFSGRYMGPELGATIGAGVAGVGSRVLHTAEPPAPKAP